MQNEGEEDEERASAPAPKKKRLTKIKASNKKVVVHESDQENLDHLCAELMTQIKSNGRAAWICNECNHKAQYRGHMVEHVEIHIEGLSFPCPTCSRTVKTRNALRKHARKHVQHQGGGLCMPERKKIIEKENSAPNNYLKKFSSESQSIKFKHGTTPRSERYMKRNEKIEKANEAMERSHGKISPRSVKENEEKLYTPGSKGDKESPNTSERGFRTPCGELTANDRKGEKWSLGETEGRNLSVLRDLGNQFDVGFEPMELTKQSSSYCHELNMSLSPVQKFYTPRQDDGARGSLSSLDLEFGTPRGGDDSSGGSGARGSPISSELDFVTPRGGEDTSGSGARGSPSRWKPNFLTPLGGEDSSASGAGVRKPSVVKVLALQFEVEKENCDNEFQDKSLESNIENCIANLESSDSVDGGSEEEEETEESDDQIEEISYGFRCAFVPCDFLVNNLQELGRHQMTLHKIRHEKDLFYHVEPMALEDGGILLHN